MHSTKLTTRQPLLHRPPSHAQSQKLLATDDPVLSFGEPPNAIVN